MYLQGLKMKKSLLCTVLVLYCMYEINTIFVSVKLNFFIIR